MLPAITLTSCQAPVADALVEGAAAFLRARLRLKVHCELQIPWQAREERLLSGEIQAGWICGAPYVQMIDQTRAPLALLAAPVMAAPRYLDRPIYFSDVVVRADRPYATFADLRGAVWAYNEPHSHSGYHVVRYHLATLGETRAFFGRVFASGAHQRSLALILAGDADASAIDSTVLDMLTAQEPTLAAQLRVIATLGPSPMPPWVVHQSVPRALRQALTDALITMHADALGQTILRQASVARFAAVSDGDYDPIRAMLRRAGQLAL